MTGARTGISTDYSIVDDHFDCLPTWREKREKREQREKRVEKNAGRG